MRLRRGAGPALSARFAPLDPGGCREQQERCCARRPATGAPHRRPPAGAARQSVVPRDHDGGGRRTVPRCPPPRRAGPFLRIRVAMVGQQPNRQPAGPPPTQGLGRRRAETRASHAPGLYDHHLGSSSMPTTSPVPGPRGPSLVSRHRRGETRSSTRCLRHRPGLRPPLPRAWIRTPTGGPTALYDAWCRGHGSMAMTRPTARRFGTAPRAAARRPSEVAFEALAAVRRRRPSRALTKGG